MLYLEEIEEKILRWLNEFPLVDRKDFQIILYKKYRKTLSIEEFDEFNLFCKDEIYKYISVSPFVEKDITVVNNRKRPITDILELEVL